MGFIISCIVVVIGYLFLKPRVGNWTSRPKCDKCNTYLKDDERYLYNINNFCPLCGNSCKVSCEKGRWRKDEYFTWWRWEKYIEEV